MTPASLGRERLQILDVVELVLGELYAHLPLKRARYGVDPLQQLRILRSGIEAFDGRDPSEFHIAIAAILTQLRDYHTRYVWHDEHAGQVSALPFLVEMYGPEEAPQYIVSKVGPGLDAGFAKGVVLDFWNGVAIDRAVLRHAAEECAGRPDSLRAASLQSLTLRALQYVPPPDERWVLLGYHAPESPWEMKEVRLDWELIRADTALRLQTGASGGDGTGDPHLRAINAAGAAVRQAKMKMFAPQALLGEVRQADEWTSLGGAAGLRVKNVTTALPDILRVQWLQLADGKPPVGYLRIWGFDVEPVDLLAELLSLLPELPQDGLILDVRGNPGGNAAAAERALRLFTPHEITPAGFALRATPRARELAQDPDEEIGASLRPWRASLDVALRNGETYTRACPLTDPQACNAIGQRYGGPVLLVADSNTYSAGDLFVAGFVDHRIGPFVCVGQATGGGGANAWNYREIRAALAEDRNGPMLPPLPQGVDLSFAFRRATRSGPNAGLIIENLGVAADECYVMTRDDLLEGNRDLLAHCITRLAQCPRSSLELRLSDAQDVTLAIDTTGLDRVDLHVNDHPFGSFAVDESGCVCAVTISVDTQLIEVLGYCRGQVLQQRRMWLAG